MNKIIPATPGWYVLSPVFAEAAESQSARRVSSVMLEQVIAWDIDLHYVDGDPVHLSSPITVEPQNTGRDPMLMAPDGRVFERGHTHYGVHVSRPDIESNVELIERFQEIEDQSAARKVRDLTRFTVIDARGASKETADRVHTLLQQANSKQDEQPRRYWPLEEAIPREEAVALLKQALARIESPSHNAEGGSMQASGAYWRLARVLTAYLMPVMHEVHSSEHITFILKNHGMVKKL
jgi:hypothetical protein